MYPPYTARGLYKTQQHREEMIVEIIVEIREEITAVEIIDIISGINFLEGL